MEIRPGKSIFYFGFVFCVLGILLLIPLLAVPSLESSAVPIIILLFLFFTGIGGYLLLHYYNYKLVLDTSKMEVKNALGKERVVYMERIERVGYRRIFPVIVVHAEGKKIHVDPMYGYFLEAIPKHKYSDELKKFLSIK
ncbi:hypothetical protein POV27_07885 [Aureisphaera galaxeae]|uniref:hypothetical protein n=1 Tax=Aureisphaera galaxeae TaxID=1538023 RepID=UPI002350CC88|nr:hypothetical protein [Aureisphaera galaxeae]MDC8003969.1 hypothetical protein [Aureisphaera galaxeae]